MPTSLWDVYLVVMTIAHYLAKHGFFREQFAKRLGVTDSAVGAGSMAIASLNPLQPSESGV
jgi:hypothetical protein